jgi:apolipoprotein N-acyltransferase
MNQWVGYAGSDWVVAAWSVVCSQAVGVWFIGSDDNEPELLISHPGDEPGRQRSRELSHTSSIALLAALLVTLALPSFVLDDMPLAVVSSDTTPFTVGCILPPFPRYKHHSLTLSDYIAESNTLSNVAKILLWPEGAVTFNSETEKEEGLAEVQKSIQGSYVAVSFEETFATPGTPAGKSSKRTGVAIVSNQTSTIYLEYYKRHLVPSTCLI